MQPVTKWGLKIITTISSIILLILRLLIISWCSNASNSCHSYAIWKCWWFASSEIILWKYGERNLCTLHVIYIMELEQQETFNKSFNF